MNQKLCDSDSIYLDDEPEYKGVVGTPPVCNWKEQPPYTPPKPTYVRPGAEDALRIKSVGYPT